MFRATHLGWQSWLFESEKSALLVDPLLGPEMGRGAAGRRSSFASWPPREFHWDSFPRVNAVFLSHEHEDHFDIPSLALIDRRVPIHLSARASRAAFAALAEMGFRVSPLAAGSVARVGDLSLTALGPDHTRFDPLDEWDTLGFLVAHRAGHGAFFSNVDIEPTPGMLSAAADARGGRNGRRTAVLASIGMSLGLFRPRSPNARGARHAHAPDKTAPSIEASRVPALLRRGDRFTPLPGQSVTLRAGKVASASDESLFLTRPPRASWPRRPSFWPDPAGEPAGPFTGRARFPRRLRPELEAGLADLARHMYGRGLFKTLYSLDASRLQGRKPTFLLILRLGPDDEALAYEYDASACAFAPVPLPKRLADSYAGWALGWAGDLLALLRGEFEPRAANRALREAWFLPPELRPSFIMETLWSYLHPLRQPQACLKQYRSRIAENRGAPRILRASPGTRG